MDNFNENWKVMKPVRSGLLQFLQNVALHRVANHISLLEISVKTLSYVW